MSSDRTGLAEAVRRCVEAFKGQPFTVRDICRAMPEHSSRAVRSTVYRLVHTRRLEVIRCDRHGGHAYRQVGAESPASAAVAAWGRIARASRGREPGGEDGEHDPPGLVPA